MLLLSHVHMGLANSSSGSYRYRLHSKCVHFCECFNFCSRYYVNKMLEHVHTSTYVKGKVTATPITGLCGPEGSGQLRLQITRHSAHEDGKVVTLTHRPPLPTGISWYSFLEAESTPGHTEMSAATE